MKHLIASFATPAPTLISTASHALTCARPDPTRRAEDRVAVSDKIILSACRYT